MGVLSSKTSPKPLQQIRNRVPELIYQLRDDFLTPRLPGAVNGTAAEPGPGTRNITDTGNIVNIVHGFLVVSGNTGFGDPRMIYSTGFSRVAGRTLKISDLRSSFIYAGWTSAVAGITGSFGYRSTDIMIPDLAFLTIEYLNTGDESTVVVPLRNNGAFYFIKSYDKWGDNFYRLLYIDTAVSGDPMYITIYSAVVSNSHLSGVAVPKKLWLPAPLLSDGFASTNEPDAVDYGGVNDGDYVRVGLGGDSRKAFFDGTNSYCDIYSADVNNKFDGTECSVIVRGKVSAAGVWADGTTNELIRIWVDANNYLILAKTNIVNTIRSAYVAGGIATTLSDITLAGTTNWFNVGVTLSDGANQHRQFINSIETAGSPIANAGVWVGNLNSNNTVIGAASKTPTNQWSGWLSDTIVLYGVVATPAQMATIHTHLDAGTLTEQILDSEFGVNNWSWWKLNESFSSDGEGHAEGVAGGIGSGGEGLLFEQPIGAFDYNGNVFHCSFVETSVSIAHVDCKTADVIITGDLTRSAGNIGICARYTDSNNYIIAYHTGANAVLYEVVAGAGNTLINAAAAYGAGNPIRLILDGTAARLYYNDVLIGTAAVNSALPDSTKHGAYSSVVDNTIDNLTVYARGTGGEYALLEEF